MRPSIQYPITDPHPSEPIPNQSEVIFFLMRSPFGTWSFSGVWCLVLGVFIVGLNLVRADPPVSISETSVSFTLFNGLLTTHIEKRTGILTSLKYNDLELLAQHQSGP